MKIVAWGALALSLVGFTAPARAALVLDQTGNVADLFQYYDAEFTFAAGSLHIPGPWPYSYGPPSMPTPPIFTAVGNVSVPTPTFSYVGPKIEYTITLTTPSPLINPGWAKYIATWYDWYGVMDGSWNYFGGNDNSGGFYDICGSGGYCGAPIQQGNTIIMKFAYQDQAYWTGDNSFRQIWYSWANGAQFIGSLPIGDLDGEYRLQVFASGIPEPATWISLILGFAGLGFVLRRKHTAIHMGLKS